MSTPPAATTISRSSGIGALAMFAAAAFIVAAGLSILAAQCPARVRLLGLFSVGWGALFGWLLSQLARRIEISRSPLELAIVALVTFGGLAGVTWQSFQRDAPPVTSKLTNPLAAAMAAQINQSPEELPDEVQQAFNAEVAAPKTLAFRDYLARRIRMLGDWPSPWPEVFWGAELTLGTSAAVAIAWRVRQQESST